MAISSVPAKVTKQHGGAIAGSVRVGLYVVDTAVTIQVHHALATEGLMRRVAEVVLGVVAKMVLRQLGARTLPVVASPLAIMAVKDSPGSGFTAPERHV